MNFEDEELQKYLIKVEQKCKEIMDDYKKLSPLNQQRVFQTAKWQSFISFLRSNMQ